MTIYKSAGHNTLTNPIINVGSDATGDLYYRNASGVFTRLAKGSQYQIVRAGATLPEYASVKDIIVLGSDATGDLYYRNAAGEFTRLAIGASSYLLKSGGTTPAWAAPNSIITLGSDADGDIYYRNSSLLQRLAKGSDGQYLSLSGGLPAWAASPSSIPSGTNMSFNQAAAPTGWTIDNTDLLDEAGKSRTVCAVHSNRYAAVGGSQNPVSMTTGSQQLGIAEALTNRVGNFDVAYRVNPASTRLEVVGSGAQLYNAVTHTVNTATLTPYYIYCIKAIKD